jgi:hypothetical protein
MSGRLAHLPAHPKKDGMDTYYHPTIENRGYWYRADDWKDVEMTGYFKLNNNAQDDFTFYTRSIQHTGDNNGCGGPSYKLDLGFDGKVYFNKEQWHVSYVGGLPRVAKDVGLGPIQGKWVGFKGMMYNIIENGKIGVKLEIWLDKNNDNTWTKVQDFDGGITDLEVSPYDGYLYILTHTGSIYRILRA